MANEEFLPLFSNLYFRKDFKKTHISELNTIGEQKVKLQGNRLVFVNCEWRDWNDTNELLSLMAKYCKVHHYTIFGSIFAKIGTDKSTSKTYQITLKKGEIQKTRMEFRCSVPRKKK